MFDPNDDIEELYRQAADRFELDNAQPDWNRFSPILDKGGVAAHTGNSLAQSLTRAIGRAFGRIPTAAWVGFGGVSSALLGAALYATFWSHRAPVAAVGLRNPSAVAASNTVLSPAPTKPAATMAGGGLSTPAIPGGALSAQRAIPGEPAAANVLGSAHRLAPRGSLGGLAPAPVHPKVAGGGISTGAANGDAFSSDANTTGGAPTLDKTLYNPSSVSLLALDPFAIRTDPQLVSLRFARVPTRAPEGPSGSAGPVGSPFDMGGWFYAGLSVSPDFSFVGGQPLTKAGHNIGLVAGFRLTSRLNLQTGLNFSKKIYYTASQNSSDAVEILHLPRFLNLQYISGNSNLLEIPVTVQYAFAKNQHGVFFASAGVSAYLLYRETFDYMALGFIRPNTEIIQVGNAQLINPPSHFLSAYDFSLGYRWNVGKSNLLLVEPYLKLPAIGLGRLDVPVSSTGLNLTFAHAFH